MRRDNAPYRVWHNYPGLEPRLLRQPTPDLENDRRGIGVDGWRWRHQFDLAVGQDVGGQAPGQDEGPRLQSAKEEHLEHLQGLLAERIHLDLIHAPENTIEGVLK
jgi:hypothetical protein